MKTVFRIKDIDNEKYWDGKVWGNTGKMYSTEALAQSTLTDSKCAFYCRDRNVKITESALLEQLSDPELITEEEAYAGDWVLVSGIRKEYPYEMTHSATQLSFDSEGNLYPEEMGDIDIHKVKSVKFIGKD